MPKLPRKRKLKPLWYSKLYVIALFVIVFGLFSVIGFIKYLNINFASADSFVSYNLENSNYLALLDINVNPSTQEINNLTLYVYDFDSLAVNSITIDPSSIINVYGKVGEEEIKKLLKISNSINNDNSLLIKSLEQMFGLNINKYIINYSDSAQKGLVFESSSYISMSKLFISPLVVSNISLREFLSLLHFKNSLTASSYNTYSFSNIESFFKKVTSLNLDSSISKENLSLAVLNGSNTSGLAIYGSFVAKNHGINVIAIKNANKTYSNSVIVTDNPNSDTVKYLKDFFDITTIMSKSEVGEEEAIRSDVLLILGLDTALQL